MTAPWEHDCTGWCSDFALSAAVFLAVVVLVAASGWLGPRR